MVRDAARTTATGRITFRFGDYGMDVPANRLVLSVKDEVRLEVALVVTTLSAGQGSGWPAQAASTSVQRTPDTSV